VKRTYYIEEFKSFRFVTYYSLRSEDDNESLTEKFLVKYESDKRVNKSLMNLVAWLENIGEFNGARYELFRPEDAASALPPPTKFLKELEERKLRLYCVWLSEKTVLLLSGGIKTANSVMDCNECRPHFLFANKVARIINEFFSEREFILDKKGKIKFTYENTIEL